MKATSLTFLLLSCALLSFSISAQEKTKYINANGYTLNDSGELLRFRQFVVLDDKIVSIDERSEHSKNIDIVDLKGKTVLPGLIDAHGHILGLGANLLEVDLRNTKSEQEAVQRVLAFVSKYKASNNTAPKWVIGRGWNQVLWPSKSFPSKASLDKFFPDVPVYLSRIDGHAAWVNSKALTLANITKSTISPSGGEIIIDATGEPTGVLIDNAEYLVTSLIPKPDKATIEAQFLAAMNHLISLGITSAHDAGINKTIRDFYIDKAESEQIPMRIYAMLAATDPQLLQMLKDGHYEDSNNTLSIRSVKAYGDGALGSRGAALLKPYSDDPDNSGLLVTAEEKLPSLFNTIIGANFQLNFHAIGDRANRLALQQFARTFENFPENKSRHRIEHAQVIAVEDIPLFEEFGIIPSMQPTHATSDMNMAEDRIGKARLKGAYAWQTFLNQGTPIAFGSDFPVELANPFHGLHAAITRQNDQKQPKDGWIANERVSRQAALKGFTLDAAYAAFQENMLGSLEVGKKADFIVIDKDYFEIEASEIRDIQVLATYVNGNLVYAID
ncbi:amidohydrolase [Glaciecola petra]|uniref:Amidohydrolase family protein n=1 Tax=Glaciecola petra TaxID=3075602 RepID=A0ABU2ZV81_9ALTE|nr:amidohydrolase family protein [Aestuariibacter sp. P117]MDT0596547.1 amidohydrolase family protein [Aestuariibacter sp. P117]